jgi:hypothetical protein
VSGRQSIADILGEVVSQMRALLDRDDVPLEERGNLLGGYVLASHLWNCMASTDQVLVPARVAGGLKQLLVRCRGPLMTCRPLVEAALVEAETLDWEFRTA